MLSLITCVVHFLVSAPLISYPFMWCCSVDFVWKYYCFHSFVAFNRLLIFSVASTDLLRRTILLFSFFRRARDVDRFNFQQFFFSLIWSVEYYWWVFPFTTKSLHSILIDYFQLNPLFECILYFVDIVSAFLKNLLMVYVRGHRYLALP